jgi:hypothetical protein
MWRACWTPWGDLMNDAVVCDASAGKDITLATSVDSRETGRSSVSQLTIKDAMSAKEEFFRKG